MLKYLLIALATASVLGCADPKGSTRTYSVDANHCTQDTVADRSNFILACIANANPKSDEEPEDWLKICQQIAEQTICPITRVRVTDECISATFGRCNFWEERTRVPVVVR